MFSNDLELFSVHRMSTIIAKFLDFTEKANVEQKYCKAIVWKHKGKYNVYFLY